MINAKGVLVYGSIPIYVIYICHKSERQVSSFHNIFYAKGLVANEELNIKAITLGLLIQIHIDNKKAAHLYLPLVDWYYLIYYMLYF